MNTSVLTAPTTATVRRSAIARHVWLIVGGLALTTLGVAAGLAWRPAPVDLVPPASLEATRASLAPNEALVEPGAPADGARAETPVTDPVQPTAPKAPVIQQRQAKAPTAPRAAPRAPAPPQTVAAATPLPTQRVAVCDNCGVVEGFREIKQKGQATGLGAVGGGVVGAALGNRVGKGNGRAAMTIIGAVGGGLAGNEIEKRVRSETVYEVRVRMDDGSVRTIQQKTAPTPGARVTVEGNTIRSSGASGSDGAMMHTSSTGV